MAGKQYADRLEKQVTRMVRSRYLVFLPKGHSPRKKWPLILFLHGAGERGNDIELVKVHGPPKIAERMKAFPFVVVSPQCPKEDWWKNDVLMVLLDDVIERYSVDADRVYLTGLSMGGYGTWSLATEYPARFAAIAPICGGGRPILAARLKDVPAWVFHGAMDEVVPLEESRRMVSALKKCGGNVRFTIYPDAGHDSWTESYNNPELYRWFLSHRRRVTTS